MKTFHTSFTLSFVLFLGAITLYFSADFLSDKTQKIIAENILKTNIIKKTQQVKNPEKHLPFLDQKSAHNIPKELSSRAQKHHLLISQTRPLPGHKIELTLQGELDSDVFDYLQDLSENFPATLSLQEIGLFRDENHVMGKVVFETFSREISP